MKDRIEEVKNVEAKITLMVHVRGDLMTKDRIIVSFFSYLPHNSNAQLNSYCHTNSASAPKLLT